MLSRETPLLNKLSGLKGCEPRYLLPSSHGPGPLGREARDVEPVRVGHGHRERQVPLQGPSLATEALGRLRHLSSVGPTCWDRFALCLKAGRSGHLRPQRRSWPAPAQGWAAWDVKRKEACVWSGRRAPPEESPERLSPATPSWSVAAERAQSLVSPLKRGRPLSKNSGCATRPDGCSAPSPSCASCQLGGLLHLGR